MLNRITSSGPNMELRQLKALQEQANKLHSKMRLELAGVQEQRLDFEAQERYYINPQIEFYDGNFMSSRSNEDFNERVQSEMMPHELVSIERENSQLNEDIRSPNDSHPIGMVPPGEEERIELLHRVKQLEEQLVQRTSDVLQNAELINEFKLYKQGVNDTRARRSTMRETGGTGSVKRKAHALNTLQHGGGGSIQGGSLTTSGAYGLAPRAQNAKRNRLKSANVAKSTRMKPLAGKVI